MKRVLVASAVALLLLTGCATDIVSYERTHHVKPVLAEGGVRAATTSPAAAWGAVEFLKALARFDQPAVKAIEHGVEYQGKTSFTLLRYRKEAESDENGGNPEAGVR